MFYRSNTVDDASPYLMAKVKAIEDAAGPDGWVQVMIDKRRGGEIHSLKVTVTYNPKQERKSNGKGHK